ncbi:hypothetical protein BsWGS_02103 [Bradybaena similaris]
MTDTSPYTIEERPIAAVWVHDPVLEKRAMTDVSDQFQERFQKPAPKKDILLAWEKKTFVSGSELDVPRSGCPVSRMEQVEINQQLVSNSPKKSTRKRSAELQIPSSTFQKVFKTDLGMSAFRPMQVVSVRRLLDENFTGRWIGRGSQHQWPARSPDLSSCDNALWGMLKEDIRKTHYNNTEQLKAAICDSLNSISPDDLQGISARTWRRIRLCAENDGEHTDTLGP